MSSITHSLVDQWNILYKNKEYAEVLNRFNAQDLVSNSSDIALLAAKSAAHLGDSQQAINILKQALTNNSQSFILAYNLAKICLIMANDDLETWQWISKILWDHTPKDSFKDIKYLNHKVNLKFQFYYSSGDYQKALAFLRINAALSDRSASFLKDMALIHYLLMNYAEAINLLDNVISSHPEQQIEVEQQKSKILLMLGRYEEGWPLWRKRFQYKGYPSKRRNYTVSGLSLPEWRGEIIPQAHILVLSEQGLADELKNIMLLDRFDKYDMNFTIECDSRLIEMLKRHYPKFYFHPRIKVDQLNPNIVQQCNDRKFNAQISMGDILEIFLPTQQSIKQFTPIRKALRPIPELKAEFSKKYQSKKPIVGIAWHSEHGVFNKERSIKLSVFMETLFANLDVRVLSLQYDYPNLEADIEAEVKRGYDVILDKEANATHNLENHIAQLASCDMVVVIDGTAAIFASLCQMQTLVILPVCSGSIWLDKGNKSIFFGTVRMLRQNQVLQWEKTLMDARRVLMAKLSLKPRLE